MLGKYPLEPYTPDASPDHVYELSQQIRIVHQSIGTEGPFERARKWIGRVERVVFLGFGFQAENLRRLNAADWSPSLELRTTGSTLGTTSKAGLIKGLRTEFGIGDRIAHQRNEPVECVRLFNAVQF